MIYLDHAAATPLDERVLAAMQPFLTAHFYNPSATYQPAQVVHAALMTARQQVAQWLGARPSELIFAAGGTEANNLALLGVTRQHPQAQVITTAIEHDSVLKSLERARREGAQVTIIQPRNDGLIDVEVMLKAVNEQTVLVSVGYANNEIGSIQPLRRLSQGLAEIRAERRRQGIDLPLLLHSDACQAGNYLDLHVARLGVDLVTLNGGKLYGPKQSGALYVKAGVELEPLIYGGGQERGLRSGTENVAAAVGFATALDIAQADRHSEIERLTALQRQFIQRLAAELPAAHINGSLKHRLPNNVHLTIPGQDNERLLIKLEQAGILAAAGSACSASDDTPSHVLRAIGLTDDEARASLRFSFGRSTTAEMIEQTVAQLAKLAV